MTRLFKKLDITGVAIMLLGFFAAVGFTAAEEVRQGTWYEVTISGTDPIPEKNQHIGAPLPGNPEGDCEEDDADVICAIELTLGTSNPSPPATVQEALDRQAANISDVEVGESMYRFD